MGLDEELSESEEANTSQRGIEADRRAYPIAK